MGYVLRQWVMQKCMGVRQMKKKGRGHKEASYFARCEVGGKGCWNFQEDSCKVMVLGVHELKNQFLR